VYDVVMDEGRALVVAFADGTQQQLAVDVCLKDILQCLADALIARDDGDAGSDWGPQSATSSKGFMEVEDLFSTNNRLGIPDTLHRISAMRSRGRIVGLTCHIRHHFYGAADSLGTVLEKVVAGNKSVLIVGPPQAGKTTLLRDIVHSLVTR